LPTRAGLPAARLIAENVPPPTGGNAIALFGRGAPMACEHENCRCDETPVEQSGKAFCSESCAEADGDSERGKRCACGHADCAAL